LCYAKRYAHVLASENLAADTLLQLSPHSRLQSMKALTTLSKYLGCYEQWRAIIRRYNLKWTTGEESLQALHRYFDDSLSLDVMMAKVKEMIRLLPTFMGQIVKFALVTGLRPGEVIESVRLLSRVNPGERQQQEYYNPERQALEHFRYPSVFLRRTKKAYISFVTPETVNEIMIMANYLQPPEKRPSYTAIRQACRKKGIYCNMAYCRKIFASYLSKEGISDTMIDMLQGRTPKSVLVQHYLTPGGDYRQKVLAAVAKLKSELEV
jgi:hypothetical protein